MLKIKMIIRKEFKFEMAHIVRRAYSTRCANNIHGHSYRIEVLLEGKNYDEAGMLIDFGLIKELIGDFIDIFDHSTMLWNFEEEEEVCKFFIHNFERVILSPFPTSAELQSRFLCNVINKVVKEYAEEEGYWDLKLNSVIVHETKTGYAQFFAKDLQKIDNIKIKKLKMGEEFDYSEKNFIISEGIEVGKWLDYYIK